MRIDRFVSKEAGTVLTVKGGHAFVPASLPPPSIVFTPRLMKFMSEAELELGRLDQLGRMLPDPRVFVEPFLRREAVLSSKIEGTHTSFSDLLLFEAATKASERRDRSAQQVANYLRALEYGLRQCQSSSLIDTVLISNMHERLMARVATGDTEPGMYRRHQVHVGATGMIANARYVPPPPKYIDDLMLNLDEYISLEKETPLLIRLALVHYQFEAIHPFGDGNGRMGRLLVTLMLCAEGRLKHPLLYLSAFFERYQDDYYDHLLGVSQRGDWQSWIEFFLQAIRDEARDAIARHQRLIDLRDSYKERFSGSRLSSNPKTLIDKLIEAPVFNAKQVQDWLGVSYPGARAVIQKLVDETILRPVLLGRTTYYIADEIVDVIEQSQNVEPSDVPAVPASRVG